MVKDYFYVDISENCHPISLVNPEMPSGGLTGDVYPVSGAGTERAVAKIYRQNVLNDVTFRTTMLSKIVVMSFRYQNFANLRGAPLAWPLGPVFTNAQSKGIMNRDEFCGFLMPRIPDSVKLERAFSESVIGGNKLSYARRALIARSVAETVAICHDANLVIGDMNPNNILLQRRSLKPGIIDCDSFQFHHKFSNERLHQFTCDYGTHDYSSPAVLERLKNNRNSFKGLKRDQQDDEFALGVLIFQLLMEGTHPFDTQDGGIGVGKISKNISEGRFPYYPGSPIEPPKSAELRLLQLMQPEVRKTLKELFQKQRRVLAKEWIELLAVQIANKDSIWSRVRSSIFGR